jgi:hypothetical protein
MSLLLEIKDELNKIFARVTKYTPEQQEQISRILLGDDPSPWDRIHYDTAKIEKVLADADDVPVDALEAIVAARKEREARRPRKHDYLQDCVERLGVELREYEPGDSRVYSMPPPNVSDIFSAEILAAHGGWYFDADQLILRNFDLYSQGYDFVCGGQTAFYIGLFGSKQNGKVISDFYGKMLNGYDDHHYNSSGIVAITNGCIISDEWMRWFKVNGENNWISPQETFYPICAWNKHDFWTGAFNIEECNSMACHYFGGSPQAQEYFRKLESGNVLGYDNNCLTRYIKRLTNNGNGYKREFCFD